MLRVALNGFGRVGRNILRACHENGYSEALRIVAINDLGTPAINAHLLSHDSVHGPFHATVTVESDAITVNGDRIRVFAESDPAKLPWGELGIDLVMECTGAFTDRAGAEKHLHAGARRVLISAPGKHPDATVVYGVNHQILRPEHRIVSNASCTTNCLAPLALVLNRLCGIQSGLLNTIHAFTNDQVLIDDYHSDLHRARAATQSMIPTKTGAASTIGEVIPDLKGKLDGLAVRVPVINVSLVDFTFTAERPVTAEAINTAMANAAQGELKDILAINALPLVSVDFNHHPASCIFDSGQTRVMGNTVKVLAWYDNEWGFSNRMLDTGLVMGRVGVD
ncbi:MAG: type I glyceraldehyde-3-phosphate dehydrogenase [Porticoccaceae bacterium]|jgi:glyceraldehyde 3-phosphate dehydrogenase|nr:type I glyceraldehyde-3-phosphate dehydrogenase [Porticoccaceae bacterium]